MRKQQRRAIGLGSEAHHALALHTLARVKRRGIDDRQQLGAGRARALRGRLKPRVLANEQAHFHRVCALAHAEHARRLAGREVAPLVKHLVIGQLALGVAVKPAPLTQHMGHVQALRHLHTAAVQQGGICLRHRHGAAHHHMQAFQPGQFAGHLIDGIIAGLDKRGPEEQVFCGVAANGQFRGQQQAGARLVSLAGSSDDEAGIAGHVTNAIIQLGNANFERHRQP